MHWLFDTADDLKPVDGSYMHMCAALKAMPEEVQSQIAEHLKSLPYQEFLRTYYWRAVRREVLKSCRFKCRECRKRWATEVHHRRYENHGYEHLHLNDLNAVCRSCHESWHAFARREPELASGMALLSCEKNA
jgi:hypothetical protein